MSAESAWNSLCAHNRETALLQSTLNLLEWDERTLMPVGEGEYRADQITYLSGMIHQRRTDSDLGCWLAELAESELASDLNSESGATIRQIKRDYDRQIKLPPELVEETARATVLGQQAWVAARERDNFTGFRPFLEKLVDLKRQEAAAVGFEDCPYDALLDEYEPGAKTKEVSQVLLRLADAIVPLIQAIGQSGREAPTGIVRREYPHSAQERFGRAAAATIGFDFNRGRLDETHHPFCAEMGPNDCRITTRYDDRFFSSAFFGILHEAGHGIYEQGLRTDQYGLPPGQYLSLGIHESQSRMWENLVGRSRQFWTHFFPLAQAAFPAALSDVALDDFYFAINSVQPSLIRVEADEITYNLHIIIRFDLEQALVNGQLSVADLPDAWNEKYQQYLNIQPPNNAEGVLQDIHWSAGLFGYFPTYSLGNLYAAQLFDQAEQDLGSLGDQFAAARFTPLRDWLREKIHRRGQCLPASELIEQVTGKPLGHEPLVRRLQDKFAPLYGVEL